MKSFSLSRRTAVGFALTALIVSVSQFISSGPATTTAADQPATTAGAAPTKADGAWGDVVGQFVLEGKAPDVPMLQNMKEPVCAKEIPSDELLVGKDGGLANVFIYIPATKKPKIHPDLAEPKEKEIVLDQKGCRFMPHAMFARAGQTLMVKSMDECNHNTRTAPIKNEPVNFTVPPKGRDGLPWKLKLAESLPTQVKCDIHPWMTAWCLILDHPYAAVSDADGKFKMEKLPVGDHEVRIWHEFGGGKYIEKAYKVSVKPGSNDLGKIKIAVDKLTAK